VCSILPYDVVCMNGRVLATIALLAVANALGMLAAQDDTAALTGLSDPSAVIASRKALMTDMERLMRPIDSYTAGEAVEPETMHSAAVTISAMLLATAHLFPPTTNRYDADAEVPETIALPAIWQDFGTFYSMTQAASAAADTLSSASGERGLHDAALGLRGACDACHGLFLLPYEPATITNEDLDFDFDSFFDDLEVDEPDEDKR
jgi:cytochrome c556